MEKTALPIEFADVYYEVDDLLPADVDKWTAANKPDIPDYVDDGYLFN